MGKMTVPCQGTWGGQQFLHSVAVTCGRLGPGQQLHVVDLGWASYAGALAAMNVGTYHVVGNLQFYAVTPKKLHVALGALPPGTTLTLPNPPGPKQGTGQWRLHFWLGPKGGSKSWLPVTVGDGAINPALRPFGLGVEAIKIKTGRDGTETVLTLSSWPADDLPICWDG